MVFTKHDLVVLSRMRNGYAEGKYPEAEEILYSVCGMDISEQEYNVLMDIVQKWDKFIGTEE